MAAMDAQGLPSEPGVRAPIWQVGPYVPAKGALLLFELALRAFWSNTSLAVPVLLFTGLSSMASLISVITLVGLLAYLTSTGYLRVLVDAVMAFDLGRLLSILASPGVLWALIVLLAVSLAGSIFMGALASAFSYSGLYRMAEELLAKGRTNLSTFLEGMSKNWRRLFPAALVVKTMTDIPTWLMVLFIFYRALSTAALTPTSPAFLFEALALIILLLVYLISVLLLTFYVLVAAALRPDLGLLACFKASFRTLARKPGDTLLLIIFEAALRAGLAFLANLLMLVSVDLTSLVSLVILLVLEPVFQVARVGIFMQAEDSTVYLEPAEWKIRAGISRSFHEGFKSLRSFLSAPENISLVLWAILPMAVGVVLGVLVGSMEDLRYAVRALGFLRPGLMNPSVRWPYGLPTSFYIAFYNWRLAISSATSGILAGVPVLLFLFANGLVIGLVGALIGDPAMALAALLPHGVVEMPAFLLASACGLRMGLAYRAFLKGQIDLDKLASVVRSCIYALVGLLPLFVLAGLIEGLVTPQVMSAFGWA